MNSIDDDCIDGDPWSVLPVKTRKFAKDCIEIVLSKRKIKKLINFDFFENLEALWLNDNKIESVDGLDKNFRIKILSIGNNRITSIENSCLINMKFLKTLFINNNKLRNLDANLTFLKNFSFLENLNLFGNPLSEEPEYRPRVVYALPSLHIFDRHKISIVEKINSSVIVKEFQDPLSKKAKPRIKRPKVSENFSETEKELFFEANQILAKRAQAIEDNIQTLKNLAEKENLPKDYAPVNKELMKCFKSLYSQDKMSECPQLETNEIRRIFNYYDPNSTGLMKKTDIKPLFFEIKDALAFRKYLLNEKLFINKMIHFYSKSPDVVPFSEIKVFFYELLNDIKPNTFDPEKLIPPLDYLQSVAFSEEELEKIKMKNIIKKEKNVRNDIFEVKSYTNFNNPKRVVLNENKLEAAYK